MKKIFLIAVIALVSSRAMAHNPLTAKFELTADWKNNAAILNIYTSQAGVHEALIKHYTQIDFTSIEINEYKKLIVQYLKKHILIHADDILLEIGEGGIKLGNHQTDLKFLIENYPSEVNTLKVEINAFQENEDHHSVFWWKTKNAKSKLILSDKNEFQGILSDKSQNSVFFLDKQYAIYYLKCYINSLFLGSDICFCKESKDKIEVE